MKHINKKLLLRIILGLITLLILPVGIGIIYLVDKQKDSPFEIEYTSAWRLKILGFEGQYSDIPNTLAKKYGDSCLVLFHLFENKYWKLIEYKVSNEDKHQFIERLINSYNVKADTSKQLFYYFSNTKDTIIYKLELTGSKVILHDLSNYE